LFDKLYAAAGDNKDATRSHGAKIQQLAAELVPAMVGGAADLVSSTKTTVKSSTSVARGEYAGRNIHYGIREHAMGSITNGLALSGFFIPYASTFLIFSDYMRPPMRLAALMEQPVTYVFTHDSIFVGEDGPTHEPVEQVWSLRLIPNLDVVRPADGKECAAAWSHALLRKDGPTALCLSRQNLPPLERPAGFDPREMLNGAYVLSSDDNPEFVLIATGSEVSVAVEAKKLLNERGRRLRVVSAPCLEAFARLSADDKEKVLPRGLKRVTLEAGVTAPWGSITDGEGGLRLGIDRFGASAPYEELAEVYGLTGQMVAAAILEKL
jgi:transketolase